MSSSVVKQKRVTQACDFCHRRGLRCRSSSDSSCQSCVDYGQECKRTRTPKKRGTKPKPRVKQTLLTEPVAQSLTTAVPVQDQILQSRKVVTGLLDVYLDTIYPSFPFFCERELWVGWREGSFPDGPSDLMSLMCMCALSAQHVGSGALFSDDIEATDGISLSQRYFDEAVRLIPTRFDAPDLNLVRSYGLLVLLGAQTGDSDMVHKYLGLYHGISAQLNLFDESRWPASIGECDSEMRRRLWWTMYRLEVHTACVLGSLVRTSEALCNVGYPKGLHHPAFIPGRDGAFENWFAGWNSTTDLYRVLEHAIADFRSKRGHCNPILGQRDAYPTAVILEKLAKIQQDLLPQFNAISSRSSDNGKNRCGFQAANILCTIHLARMISSISSGISLRSACETAADMIATVETILLEYLRAIGSPLIQQLAGVGYILLGVLGKQRVSEDDYTVSHNALVSMIAFMAQLSSSNATATAAERRLAAQLEELEKRGQVDPNTNYSLGNLAEVSQGEPFSWSQYLDQIFPDRDDTHDIFSTNMINILTWQ